MTISIPATSQRNELPAGTVVHTFTITDDLGGNSSSNIDSVTPAIFDENYDGQPLQLTGLIGEYRQISGDTYREWTVIYYTDDSSHTIILEEGGLVKFSFQPSDDMAPAITSTIGTWDSDGLTLNNNWYIELQPRTSSTFGGFMRIAYGSIDETAAEYEPYVSAWTTNAESAQRPYVLEVSHSMGEDDEGDPVLLQDLVLIDIRNGGPDDEYTADNGASSPTLLGSWMTVSSWEAIGAPGPAPSTAVFQKTGSIITMSRAIYNESPYDRGLRIFKEDDTNKVSITVQDQSSFFLDRRPDLIPPQVHPEGQFPGSAVFDSETGAGDVVINNKNFSSAYAFLYEGSGFSYYQNLLFNNDGTITLVSEDGFDDNGNNSNYGNTTTYNLGTWTTNGITFNTNWQGSAQEYQDNAGVSFYNKFNLYYIGT
ncbi:MAG: hypothetical protein GWP32_01450 [Bacteroidetes bacterium]|nr:hypothetical protein [Bacteroidota bacterium]